MRYIISYSTHHHFPDLTLRSDTPAASCFINDFFLLYYVLHFPRPEVGIYKRRQAIKKERKHAYDQESDQEKKKNDSGQEKEKENTLSTKKIRFNKKR